MAALASNKDRRDRRRRGVSPVQCGARGHAARALSTMASDAGAEAAIEESTARREADRGPATPYTGTATGPAAAGLDWRSREVETSRRRVAKLGLQLVYTQSKDRFDSGPADQFSCEALGQRPVRSALYRDTRVRFPHALPCPHRLNGRMPDFLSGDDRFESGWGYHLSGCSAVWSAHSPRARGVASSNLAIRTIFYQGVG